MEHSHSVAPLKRTPLAEHTIEIGNAVTQVAVVRLDFAPSQPTGLTRPEVDQGWFCPA